MDFELFDFDTKYSCGSLNISSWVTVHAMQAMGIAIKKRLMTW